MYVCVWVGGGASGCLEPPLSVSGLVCSLCVPPTHTPYVPLSGFSSWDVLFLNHSRAGHKAVSLKKFHLGQQMESHTPF